MMPGYLAGGYFSPILINEFRRLKTGRNLIEMSFFNAGYADGVQGFQIKGRVIKRAAEFLVLDLEPNGQPERAAIVSEVSFGWLERHVPQLQLPETGADLEQILRDFYFGRTEIRPV